MGKHDSSLTRVAPLFDALFARDDAGSNWLNDLLTLGSRRKIVATLPRTTAHAGESRAAPGGRSRRICRHLLADRPAHHAMHYKR